MTVDRVVQSIFPSMLHRTPADAFYPEIDQADERMKELSMQVERREEIWEGESILRGTEEGCGLMWIWFIDIFAKEC